MTTKSALARCHLLRDTHPNIIGYVFESVFILLILCGFKSSTCIVFQVCTDSPKAYSNFLFNSPQESALVDMDVLEFLFKDLRHSVKFYIHK